MQQIFDLKLESAKKGTRFCRIPFLNVHFEAFTKSL